MPAALVRPLGWSWQGKVRVIKAAYEIRALHLKFKYFMRHEIDSEAAMRPKPARAGLPLTRSRAVTAAQWRNDA